MQILKTNILTPVSLSEVRYLPGVWLVIEHGKIKAILDVFSSGDYLDYGNKLIIAPFCDLHNHMAQYRIMGINGRSLPEWLNSVTFPEEIRLNKDYTDVYEQSGLLGQRTLLGHGIYLSDNELERLSNLKAAIIHCPTSNAFLQSGIFGVRKAWDRGVRTGIGTDIGAGYSLSMFNEMKNAVEASKYYALLVVDFPALTPAEVFYMATLGNAKIIGLDNQIGSIEVGKQATFLVLDHCFGDWYSSPHDLLSGLIYSNEKQTIKEFWIDGKNKFLDIRDIKL